MAADPEGPSDPHEKEILTLNMLNLYPLSSLLAEDFQVNSIISLKSENKIICANFYDLRDSYSAENRLDFEAKIMRNVFDLGHG
jgi:hypothetical protein